MWPGGSGGLRESDCHQRSSAIDGGISKFVNFYAAATRVALIRVIGIGWEHREKNFYV